TAPTIISGTLAGGDTATLTETYDTKNQGSGKTLAPAATVKDGSNADMTANYAVTLVNNTSGVINTRPITVTAQANTKTYDGTTSSATAPTITSGTLHSGDTAKLTETYDTKNEGSGKTLTPAATVTDGSNADKKAKNA